MQKKTNKPAAVQSCAVHTPGSPDCGPTCPHALRSPDATPGLVFATSSGFVGAPADVERAKNEPTVGPADVEEMDEAVADIEQRDDESDEVDADVDGDEDGPVENTDAEDERALADVGRLIEDGAHPMATGEANYLLCIEANERLTRRVAQLEGKNRELHKLLMEARAAARVAR